MSRHAQPGGARGLLTVFRVGAGLATLALLAMFAVVAWSAATDGDRPYRAYVPMTARDATGGTTGVRVLPPPQGVYHSAFPDFGGEEDRVTGAAISDFAKLVGKPIVWAYFSNNWFEGIKFPAANVKAAHDAGAIPFIRMMPRSTWDEEGPDPVYPLEAIAGGQFDADLRQWAHEAKAVKYALMVEFGTEVNGDWFPWNGAYNGGDPAGPARFRTAYRRIIDIFRAEGVSNVTWVFHVDAQASPEAAWNAMANYYPGDSYIDWLGISAYGAQSDDEDWQSFTEVMDIGYPQLAALSSSKPIALLEFGVTEGPTGGMKAEWIADALAAVRAGRYPRIKAVSYWHENWMDEGVPSQLRLDSSSEALNAYRTAIADPFFVTTAVFGE